MIDWLVSLCKLKSRRDSFLWPGNRYIFLILRWIFPHIFKLFWILSVDRCIAYAVDLGDLSCWWNRLGWFLLTVVLNSQYYVTTNSADVVLNYIDKRKMFRYPGTINSDFRADQKSFWNVVFGPDYTILRRILVNGR